MKQVSHTASSASQSGKNERSVADTLAAGSTHHHFLVARRGFGGNIALDLDGLAKDPLDDSVIDRGCLLFIRLADPAEQDNLLLMTRVLLVNLHDIEQFADTKRFAGGQAGDPGIVKGDRQGVGGETPGETAHGDLAENAQLSSDLGLQYDTDGYTFTVQHLGRKNSFDSVPDRMTKVDEISKSGLSFVDRDDVRLDIDTAGDDGQQQRLVFSSSSFESAEMRISSGTGLDSSDDFVRAGFQERKVVVLPDSSSLKEMDIKVSEIQRGLACLFTCLDDFGHSVGELPHS